MFLIYFSLSHLQWHDRLSSCVPPKFIHWNLILNLMSFRSVASWKWLSNEGRTLTNGISTLREKMTKSYHPFHHLKSRGRSSNQELGFHQTLNLQVPWSWTSWPPVVRNKCLLLRPPSLVFLLTPALTNLDIWQKELFWHSFQNKTNYF